jgi:predicted DsbA family dithiol-disulfide isomerase
MRVDIVMPMNGCVLQEKLNEQRDRQQSWSSRSLKGIAAATSAVPLSARFEAHFVLGEDLEDPAVIDAHAHGSGVALAALHAALADGRAMAAVAETETIAREYGVQGTPAWLLAQRLITGLLPAAEFECLVEHAMQLPR